MTTLAELLDIANADKRICPQPSIWNNIYSALPSTRHPDGGFEPSAPLILAAWWVASDEQKRERFHMHLAWAAEHDALEKVADILKSMKPDDWYTEN